jgi:glycosyltransferase involved in cell wall biosynthesis
MLLSVIVPARNEEEVLRPCLESLTAQSGAGFELNRDWELILVNDHSTDHTAEMARSIAGVTVLESAPLPKRWTGKANALWGAAQKARGSWLLFTDADTRHEPGDLERAVGEAERNHVALLSYSPRQEVSGFWQRALMPLVFAELAQAYPPARVSDPASRLAAANGQFLMVERSAYFAVGGHSAVASSLLEDVDLAAQLKRRKYAIRFRYAPEAVSTRMYRTAGAMLEGWTKNLARLFANPIVLAATRALDILLLIALPLLAVALFSRPLARYALGILWLRTLWRCYARARKSNFSAFDCALSIFALPLFCGLLLRSWFRHSVTKRVAWKGREYST